jgi:uncharacterized membrane protein (GlpM family)
MLHLVLAFTVGSVWVTLVTLIAEKAGSVVGGIVGGLPSTSVYSFFFIGFNQSPTTAAQATAVFPLAFSFTCIFLLSYAFFAWKGFGASLFISLTIWFALSSLAVISGIKNFALSLAVSIPIFLVIYYFFSKKLKFENLPGGPIRHTSLQIVGRAIFAGSIVSLAVLLSQIGGPIFGGIFAAFPATFTSTLYIVNKSRGADFSRAITKPLIVSGTLTIIPYTAAVRYLYPSIGIWLGTIASYAVVAPLAIISYRIIKQK